MTAGTTYEPISAAEASLDVLLGVLTQVGEADQENPTPCDDFTCRELAEHLFGSLVGLGGMAGGEVATPQSGSLRDKVAAMGTEALDAWRLRGLDGEVTGPGGREVAAVFGPLVLNLEFLLHAWDFAQATGQHVEVDDDLITYVSEQTHRIIHGGRHSGAFAEATTPADDAAPLDRLAAFSGRSPLAV